MKKSDTIGNRLKEWRKHLGMTQDTYSSLVGVSIGVYKKYEAGYNVPGGEALAAFSTTGVNINWLLTGEGDMSEPEPDEPPTLPANLPHSLEYYQSRFDKIFELLLQIDEDERGDALDEMLIKVKEVARVQKMEKMLESLQIKPDDT